MATTVRTERKKRGLIGKLFLLVFWIYNALMAFVISQAFVATGEQMSAATTKAQQAGTAVGAALGTGMILMIWLLGATILGLLVMMTPGKTIITETTKD